MNKGQIIALSFAGIALIGTASLLMEEWAPRVESRYGYLMLSRQTEVGGYSILLDTDHLGFYESIWVGNSSQHVEGFSLRPEKQSPSNRPSQSY